MAPIGQLSEFDILCPKENPKIRPEVAVKSPNGLKVPVKLQETVDGYVAGFTPTLLGPHTVSVEANGNPIGNSPYKITATDSIDSKAYPEVEEPLLINATYSTDNTAYNKPSVPAQNAKFLPQEKSNIKSFSNPNQQRGFVDQNPVEEDIVRPTRKANEKVFFSILLTNYIFQISGKFWKAKCYCIWRRFAEWNS